MAYRRTAHMRQRLAGNRARIVRAARELIAHGGLRRAQVGKVAVKAGLSTGALYRYFPSQTDLFIAVLREAVQHEIGIMRQVAVSPGTSRARLRAAVESFVRRALEGPYLSYAFIAEPADARMEAARLRERRALAEVFKDVVRDGIAAGDFPPQDLDITAACIFGAFTEALVGPIASRGVRDQDELVRSIVTFCERAVAGRISPPLPATAGRGPG